MFARKTNLDETIETLCKSRTGKALYERAVADGVSVGLGDGGSAGNRVEIAANLGEGEAVAQLARQLRRHGQDKAGFNPDPAASPEERMLVDRIRAADEDSVTVQVAGELYNKGEKSPYEALDSMGLETARRGHLAALMKDKEGLHDGRAARAGFEACFADSAWMQATDAASIENSAAAYRDPAHPGFSVQRLRQVNESLRRAGNLPGGGNYLEDAVLDTPPYNAPTAKANTAGFNDASAVHEWKSKSGLSPVTAQVSAGGLSAAQSAAAPRLRSFGRKGATAGADNTGPRPSFGQKRDGSA
jgi:hypothetical protein